MKESRLLLFPLICSKNLTSFDSFVFLSSSFLEWKVGNDSNETTCYKNLFRNGERTCLTFLKSEMFLEFTTLSERRFELPV